MVGTAVTKLAEPQGTLHTGKHIYIKDVEPALRSALRKRDKNNNTAICLDTLFDAPEAGRVFVNASYVSTVDPTTRVEFYQVFRDTIGKALGYCTLGFNGCYVAGCVPVGTPSLLLSLFRSLT